MFAQQIKHVIDQTTFLLFSRETRLRTPFNFTFERLLRLWIALRIIRTIKSKNS